MISNLLQYDLLVHFVLVSCRISSFITLLPISNYFNAKSKVLFALLFSFCVASFITQSILTKEYFFFAVFFEIVTGLLIGSIVYLIFSAITLFGELFSMQANLTSFMVMDNQFDPQSMISVKLLNWIVIAIFFSTNTHLLFLHLIVESYSIVPILSVNHIYDLAILYCYKFNDIFSFGFKIAAPIWIVSFTFMFAIGILGRLIPQIQIFFISLPIQYYLMLFILLLTAMNSIVSFKEYHDNKIEQLLEYSDNSVS